MKKLLLILIGALLCLAPKAHAAIVFDASSTYSTSTNLNTFLIATATVTSSPNTVLLFAVQAMTNGNSSTAASWNGTPMTLLNQQTISGVKQSVYYLLNPTSGTHNVSTSLFSATANIVLSTISFAGVSGIGNSTSTQSTAATTTISLPLVNSGDTVIDFMSAASSITATKSAGWNLLFAGTYPVTPARTMGFEYVATSSPANASWTLGGSVGWVENAVELLPSANAVSKSSDVTISANAGITIGKNAGITIR